MPTTRYEIYVKELLCFTKYSKQEFDRVCSDLNKLQVNYTTKIIKLA